MKNDKAHRQCQHSTAGVRTAKRSRYRVFGVYFIISRAQYQANAQNLKTYAVQTYTYHYTIITLGNVFLT